MVQEIRSHLGILSRRQDPPTQRFDAHYFGVNTEQLRSSNYPDHYFSGYSLHFYDGNNMVYRLDVDNKGRWGTTRTEVPKIHLANYGEILGFSPEDRLVRSIDTMAKLCKVLTSKGRLEWSLNAASNNYIIVDANITIHPEEQQPKAFSTKDELADFVESLP